MMPQQTENQERKDSLIDQAYLAFERDAPLFYPEHCGEWVAYHGDKRVGFGATRAELWQECLSRGVPDGEFWVFNIQPIVSIESIGLGMTKIEYFDR
jgi:hypothetical protein